jgi:hypothetical protein
VLYFETRIAWLHYTTVDVHVVYRRVGDSCKYSIPLLRSFLKSSPTYGVSREKVEVRETAMGPRASVARRSDLQLQPPFEFEDELAFERPDLWLDASSLEVVAHMHVLSGPMIGQGFVTAKLIDEATFREASIRPFAL